jgi:hypothetical protein
LLPEWNSPLSVHTRRARQEQAHGGTVASAVIAVTFGSAVVLLKALVH